MPPPPDMARIWADHLRAEEAALTAVCAALNELNAAVKAPAAAMPDAADRLAAAAAELQLLDAARQTIRRSAAQVLAIPDDAVTVSVVAAALPAASAAELRAGQRRLRELGEQTAALARQSSAVLACGRSFTRRLLAELLGIADAQRYGPSGQRLESSTAGLVQGAL